MAQFIQGSAPKAVMELIKHGAIKNKFVAEIFQHLISDKIQLYAKFEEFKKRIDEMEARHADFQNKANNYKRTITQTHGYDTTRCEDYDGGESKDSDKLTEDDKIILRENFEKEFGWNVPPNKKNDFNWIKEKITHSKKYREEYRKRQQYRKNKEGTTERND